MENIANLKKTSISYINGLQQELDHLNIDEVANFISVLESAYESGKHIFIAGNGGSASTSSHMASDLNKTVIGRDYNDHKTRFKAISLSDNIPQITAWANDVDFDEVFAQQLVSLADPGDLLIVITGSGNSRNIIRVVEEAIKHDVKTFGLLGFDGGKVKSMLDGYIHVKCYEYGFVEDIHMMMDHLVSSYFKNRIEKQTSCFEQSIIGYI